MKFLRRWIVLAALATPLAAAAAEPLRVCADPDNLPFSKSDGAERGLYVEVAELVGSAIDAPVQWVWWDTHNQRRSLRQSIGANACDAVIALPANADYKVRNVEKSRPFLNVSYAVVARPGFAFRTLDDLRGQRLGVQFSTTPQVVLASMGGFRTTTYRVADEALDALAAGEIDAALLWGPDAGYTNRKRFGDRFAVTPVSGHDFAGQVVIGVRRDKPELLASIDRALADLKPRIEALADKYGFPRGKPVELASFARATRVPAAMVVTVADGDAAEASSKGRVRFNSQCSHCHGSDAVSPLRERDLRRLKLRYDAGWRDVALTTIRNGRNDKGMPTWGGVLKEEEIAEVLAFLNTIQK